MISPSCCNSRFDSSIAVAHVVSPEAAVVGWGDCVTPCTGSTELAPVPEVNSPASKITGFGLGLGAGWPSVSARACEYALAARSTCRAGLDFSLRSVGVPNKTHRVGDQTNVVTAPYSRPDRTLMGLENCGIKAKQTGLWFLLTIGKVFIGARRRVRFSYLLVRWSSGYRLERNGDMGRKWRRCVYGILKRVMNNTFGNKWHAYPRESTRWIFDAMPGYWASQ